MTADEEKRSYEDNWSGNSRTYSEQGCYDWMAAQLDVVKPAKVFDVGCGTGEGLLALRRRFGCQILSIDENSYCLRKTATRLRSAGAKVQVKERFHYLDQAEDQHIIGVESGEISMSREVMLLQGDPLLADTELFKFVESKGPFDAVTIWLMGTIQGRRSCMNIVDFKIAEPGDYRWHVQNKTYELAARILRSGGILQVVDRGGLPKNDTERSNLLAEHHEQASTTDLQVMGFESYRYNELTGGKGIRVAPARDQSGTIPSDFAWSMLSVSSRKP